MTEKRQTHDETDNVGNYHKNGRNIPAPPQPKPTKSEQFDRDSIKQDNDKPPQKRVI